jgi:V/A-type H+-transporting ATPase subunit C
MTGIPYEVEDDSYYLFTSAELKARENQFVDQGRIERMLSSADMDEFLKILGETSYAPGIGDIKSLNSFEPAMLAGFGEIIDYLEERLKSEHKKIIPILFFEEFLHNTKIVLKSILLEEDLGSLYLPLKYEYSHLMEAYRDEKYGEIESPISEILECIRKLLGEVGEKDPRQLELSLEKFYTGTMLETAEGLGRKMMVNYIRHKIDLINIETMYRHMQLKISGPFSGYLHEGGSLEPKMLADLEGESMDYTVKQLEKKVFGDAIIKGVQWLFSDCSFSAFERNRDLYFLDYFGAIKYTVSNLEKIFSFFLRKKIELTNINILYTGIRFNADKTNLRCKVD